MNQSVLFFARSILARVSSARLSPATDSTTFVTLSPLDPAPPRPIATRSVERERDDFLSLGKRFPSRIRCITRQAKLHLLPLSPSHRANPIPPNADKTTSDLLPSSTPPDLLSSLRLADLIRSSSVPSASATKSLLKRLTHPNPNVQLLALGVFDICVKNGGNAFLAQVGAKECSAELEGIVRARGEGSNREVREKVKAKVQDWATAFAAKSGLGGCELVWAYERMKKDGVEFPPRDPLATAAMVDSLSVS